jgi:lipopolysaccharide/colanic/teichoic acid biosynthesis glycosyltransferase
MARVRYRPGHTFFVKAFPPWKRALDLVVGVTALVCLSPLLAAVAVLIAVASPGPVLFGQRRAGLAGQEFTMWKFRSMRVGTDTAPHERAAGEEIATNRTLAKVDDRAQLIPLGALLRKSCLDELPQLFNVLRGEMSLVGPRPDPVYVARQYHPWHRLRLDVRPGMTGLWQVSGKNTTTFRQMLMLDLAYARGQSLALDLWILLKTPGAVLADLWNAAATEASASLSPQAPQPVARRR